MKAIKEQGLRSKDLGLFFFRDIFWGYDEVLNLLTEVSIMKKKGIKYLLTGIGVAILRSRDQKIANEVEDCYVNHGFDMDNKKHVRIMKRWNLIVYAIIALIWPVVIVDSYCVLLAEILEKKFPTD